MLALLRPTQRGAAHKDVSSLNEGRESREKMGKLSTGRKQVNFHQGKDLERLFEKKSFNRERSLPTGRRYTEM